MAMTRRTVLVSAAALATISRAGFAAAAGKGRSIVIFYSRTGTIKGLAQSVAKLTGAETLELALEQPYAANYSDMTYIAREERQKGARREIATTIPDLTSYDTIFLGTPYWWGGVSIPMRTFLMDYPLDGKTIVPFVVSGSSSPEGAWEDIRTYCPKAKILEGFHRTQSEVADCEADLKAWLQNLKLI